MGVGPSPEVNEKTFEPEDPMELVGVKFEQEPDEAVHHDMACSIVEEYMRMGWTGENIMRLFRNPAFKLSNDILQQRGEDYVQGLVDSVDEMRAEVARKLKVR